MPFDWSFVFLSHFEWLYPTIIYPWFHKRIASFSLTIKHMNFIISYNLFPNNIQWSFQRKVDQNLQTSFFVAGCFYDPNPPFSGNEYSTCQDTTYSKGIMKIWMGYQMRNTRDQEMLTQYLLLRKRDHHILYKIKRKRAMKI